MKNSVNVYWSRVSVVKDRDLLTIKPTFLLQELKKGFSNSTEFLRYLSCPAASSYLKNTLCVKSEKDISFSFSPETLFNYQNKVFKDIFFIRSFEDKWIDLKEEYIFFSDESLEVSLLPANFNNNSLVSNSIYCSGQMNIGKWYRPFNPSYILKKDSFSIKRNDVLYYIKFHTDKKINLIHYEFTPKLSDYTNAAVSLKDYLPKKSFKFIYNLFLSKNYNQRILKEIKNNLTGY